MTPLSRPARVANLDLLRAAAIGLVVVVNMVGKGILDLGPLGNQIAESSWVGVDLFFLLSGWLVGGLYWRELKEFGNVEIGRFWGRRWLRTIPPYVVVLGVVWSVYVTREGGVGVSDWRYAVFAQNYLSDIPFWAVSWSLCVEEHFYLALPIVLGVALRIRGGVPLALGGAALASLAARVLTVPDGASPWGIQYTATHMRLEGLALGVAAAYIFHQREDLWPGLQRIGRVLLIPGLVFVMSVPWLPPDVLNRWGFAGVDLGFLAALVLVVDRPPVVLAASRAIRGIALASYSVYMTHTSVLDLYRRTVMEAVPGMPAAVHVATSVLLIGAVGAVFYVAVERPSIHLRSRLVPRRRSAPRVPAIHMAL